ncbi:transcriptional regulator, TetR family [Paraoerskovia marina]|uniref:Transcriptional regulator, TetR family n=1 Tax=Paraoerskovia marina TaxID=545619 RepID=A0A1H1M0K9_9CELL|nr:TetR/AcrR family transcriptional regulator [Paraoerskovia marina]SDR80356.1 transcriptional regulator, TetR family [Paraoerskovia marina]
MSTSAKAPIGRPRLFDEETVLASLTALFWRQGYSQTSISDIVEASGVHKPSLYRTFGSKEELFAKVLRRYLAERMAMFGTLVAEAGPGIEGVHRFLDLFEVDAVSEQGRDGCLMVMASNELRGRLPGYDFSVDYREQMREQIQALVRQGCPEAEEDVVTARTDLLTTYLLGLHVVMRAGAEPAEIHRYLHAMHVAVDDWRSR